MSTMIEFHIVLLYDSDYFGYIWVIMMVLFIHDRDTLIPIAVIYTEKNYPTFELIFKMLKKINKIIFKLTTEPKLCN